MSQTPPADASLIDLVRTKAIALTGSSADYEELLEAIGDRSIVLLGESTHGTHEFYEARAAITRRLIEEKGFSALALEADGPDCQPVNQFIQGTSTTEDPVSAMSRLQRFPMWMWRNREMLELISWLKSHNHRPTTKHQISVFGLDLFNLSAALREVIAFLDRNDMEAADRARRLYACFDYTDQNPARYGRHVRTGSKASCEKEVIEVLRDLPEAHRLKSRKDDELFFVRENAECVVSAEAYYRNLFNPLVNTWNIRARHMTMTVERIRRYLELKNRPAKVIVWAHNSHIGDCRATDMCHGGQWNLGELLRKRFSDQTFHVGFTTYQGRVQSAANWNHPPKPHLMPPALAGSYEHVFHASGLPNFLLLTRSTRSSTPLEEERLERAIGVIYSQETDRLSHYLNARLARQFDAVLHFDHSTPVQPLDLESRTEVGPPSEIQL